jgi:2-polyprenyl-3-methyl-5-hydroxy-6-metoxy-1,4-benzoquinol methylase
VSTVRRWLRRRLDEVNLAAFVYDMQARLAYARDSGLRRENERLRAGGAPDGLPLPPPHLVYLVAGHFNLAWYYESGATHADLLREALRANGYDIEAFRALLDFGCGCGRVTRHWHALDGVDVHGSDANAQLVSWCSEALPFARFDRNLARPSLRYADATFDFIYAISVFTHLTEELQHGWIRELRRVLAPNGVLAITTKGISRLEPLGPDERARFEQGQLIVRDARYSGRNLCAAFHPERYVREVLAADLEVVDFRPATEDGSQSQDVWLLRRPPSA